LEHVDFIASAGDGGFVEECYSSELDKNVAVKKADTHSKGDTNEKLAREVINLRTVRHWHCVQILGSFIWKDWFNIIMEPVAICDLRTYLMHGGPSHKLREMESSCGPRTVFLPTTMGCLAHALSYLHEDPRLRHRDIKPANILLDKRRVLFTDCGLSKTFTDTESGTSGPSAKTPMVSALSA
jgi:serine/threonine protein kinase